MVALKQPVIIKRNYSRPLDRVAYVIAAGAGAGFAPVAPGTFGSAEGVIIYFVITALSLEPITHLALLLITGLLLFALGVWAASRACRISGLKDPGVIVIDEVSGQLIGIAPLALSPSVAGAILAFLLFRFFDIFKPYPINRLERLPSGLGVMSDDALAGVYTALLIYSGLVLGLI
jgi:phosphatidylglycerophosphatase A